MDKILKGQLTYDRNSKSWTYTPQNKLTADICYERNKIQGHKDFYIGHVIGNHTHPSNDLEEMILWVENNA